MASLTAGTTFTDGVANDVTAAKLGALVTNATPTSGFIQDRTAETVVATDDTLLIGDASDSNNLKRMTVANLLKAPLVSTSGTVDNLTTGTTTSTAQIVTSGTTATFNSTTGTIANLVTTTGTIGVGTFGTTTSTAATITTGTITTGVIPTLTSTTLITTGTGTAASPAIVPTGDTNTGIFFPVADTIAATTNGTERLRIDSTGNVGIGITPSGQKLDVNGSSVLRGTVFVGDASSAVFRKVAASTPLYFANQAGAIEMTVDLNGNVGIGTTGPAVKLDVSNGNIQGKEILLQNGAASSPALGTTPSWYSPASGVAALSTDGAERLRIEATGTLKSQPTYDNTAAGSAVIVTSAGLIRRTSSSIKYKKDIENLYGSIVDNAILNLRPVWYRTKNPEGDDKSTWSHVGLIAEEVNSVEPRLVKYKTVEVSIGENGERIETQLENPIPEDVDYAKLSVILLSEVKAQKLKIASLEARIEALEAA